MQIQEVDRTIERRILVGLLVSTEFIRHVETMLKPEYLGTSGAIRVYQWIMDYYHEYDKAPAMHIQDIYVSKLKSGEIADEDDEEYIRRLLGKLSREWEATTIFNVPYLIDVTEKFCRTKHLESVRDTINGYLAQGSIDEAESLITSYKPVTAAYGEGLDPIIDKDGIEYALTRQLETVFHLPGALGRMMNPQFYRGSFIGFLAPEKRGKSYILQEFMMRGLRSNINVALFEAGDMTKDQRYCRIHSYISKLPVKRLDASDDLDLITVRYPLDFDGDFEERHLPPLDWTTALREGQNWLRRFRRGKLRMSVHDSDTLTVGHIDNTLERWSTKYDFVPDLLVVDYVDIMASENAKLEFRHQENAKWKGLRRLSQKWHACVITCTQANAAAYNKENLNLSNFSEDKRKYAHVTAMYALNQTEEEKDRNVLRIGELILREGGFSSKRQVEVLQCLDIGRPYIDSRIRRQNSSDNGDGGE